MSRDDGIAPQDDRSAIPAPRRENTEFWRPTAPGPGRGSTDLPPLRLPAENPNLLTARPVCMADQGPLATDRGGRPGCQILAASRQDTAELRAAEFEAAVRQNLAMFTEVTR